MQNRKWVLTKMKRGEGDGEGDDRESLVSLGEAQEGAWEPWNLKIGDGKKRGNGECREWVRYLRSRMTVMCYVEQKAK